MPENAETYGLPRIKKRTRLRPDKQAEFEEKVVDAYVNRNASIRALAEESGRSYGSIHRILAGTEGVTMRGRGGAHYRGGRPRRSSPTPPHSRPPPPLPPVSGGGGPPSRPNGGNPWPMPIPTTPVPATDASVHSS